MIFKFLDCRWGDHRARWRMSMMSDKPATDDEIRLLFREMDRSKTCHRFVKKHDWTKKLLQRILLVICGRVRMVLYDCMVIRFCSVFSLCCRPTKADISRKLHDIEEAKNFQYTDDVVQKIVEQKRQTSRPSNILMEIERLRVAIEASLEKGDMEAVERMQADVRNSNLPALAGCTSIVAEVA